MKVPALDAARPVLLGLAGLGVALAVAIPPVLDADAAWRQIDAGRARLARVREAAARPPQPQPLVGGDADALRAAFRARLDALAAERAVVIDRTDIEPDPARPTTPRLRAALRGTAEGLHGLLRALEGEPPLVAVEEADLGVDRPADAEIGRPTVMRLAFTARGVFLAAEPGRTGP